MAGNVQIVDFPGTIDATRNASLILQDGPSGTPFGSIKISDLFAAMSPDDIQAALGFMPNNGGSWVAGMVDSLGGGLEIIGTTLTIAGATGLWTVGATASISADLALVGDQLGLASTIGTALTFSEPLTMSAALTGLSATFNATGTALTLPTGSNASLGGSLTVVGTSTLAGTGVTTLTASDLASFSGGLSFQGGALNAAGRLSTDTNWGGWLQGRAGAVADLALVGSGGQIVLAVNKVAQGNYLQARKPIIITDGTNSHGTQITWDGGATTLPPNLPPNVAFMSWGEWSGTASFSPGTQMPLNAVFVDDNMALTSAGAMHGLQVAHTVWDRDGTTTLAKGDRVALSALLTQRQSTSTTGGASFIAFGPGVEARESEGGTGVTSALAAGAIWGTTLGTTLRANAEYFNGQTGIEVDVWTEPVAGRGPRARQGIFVLNYAGSASRGIAVDSAFSVGNAEPTNTTSWWKYGFAVGYSHSETALDAHGIAFGTDAVNTGGFLAAKNTMGVLLDGRNSFFNDAQIRLRNMRVMPNGDINTGTLKLSSTAGPATIDVSHFVGPAENTVFSGGTLISGGTGMAVGLRGEDQWGGVYRCSSVDGGGVATAITCYTQPSDTASHTGNVTITFNPATGAGGTVTVAQTWTAGTTLGIGTASATTITVGRTGQIVSFPGSLNGQAITAAGLLAGTAGLSINGGSAGAGRMFANSTFGLFVQPRVGTTADLAIADSSGTGILRILPVASTGGSSIQFNKPLGIRGTANPIPISWSSNALIPPNQVFHVAADYSGTVPAGGGNEAMYSWINIASDVVDAATNVTTGTGFNVTHNVNTGARGDRVAERVLLYQKSATGLNPDGGGMSFIARGGGVEVGFNAGGTAVTQAAAAGQMWGQTLTSLLDTGATFWRAQTGIEIDLRTKESVLARVGAFVLNYPDSTAQGFSFDVGMGIVSNASNATASQFEIGFAVGFGAATRTLRTTGVAFQTGPVTPALFTADNNTMGSFADGRHGTYTKPVISMPAYRLLQTGDQAIGNLALSFGENGVGAIDVSWFVGPADGGLFNTVGSGIGVVGQITSGGTGVAAGYLYSDAYGGLYTVTLVDGSNHATEIAVYRRPMDSVDRTGTITLTPHPASASHGAGGTVTVTQTWQAGTAINLGTTAATSINIGRSASTTSIAGRLKTAALLTNAANDAAAASAGVGVGEFYRNASVVMQRAA